MAEIQLWHWLAFGGLVALLLILDLGVFHRTSHETTLREAGIATAVWAAIALGFNGVVLGWLGSQAAQEFLTGYLVEWSLSMDNVFVFAVIFGYFGVPKKFQYRVLFWGILGAVFMRLSFVLLGASLMHHVEWLMLLFGGFLIYTGLKLWFSKEADPEPEKSWVLRLARRYLRIAPGEHGDRFFVRTETGGRAITPLFLVLLVVESTDVIFAVDSVPAILGVVSPGPHQGFVAFTSNVFAILGLRALYFLLAGVMNLFHYLHYGLSAILIFIGAKMSLKYIDHQDWAAFRLWPLPDWASLVVVLGLLVASIGLSLAFPAKGEGHASQHEA